MSSFDFGFKKKFGQIFLKNENIAGRIVEELEIKNGECVIEIGAGDGVLTKYLVQKECDLKVIEIDGDLIDGLVNKFPELDGKIINCDVLKVDFNKVFEGRKIKVIGNFPYNISGVLIEKFYKNRNVIDCVVGMLQKEVVDRIVAEPGSRIYGFLSVLVQSFFKVKRLFNVGSGNFFPKPKVVSSVFRFERGGVKNLGCDEDLFVKVLKICFSSRRKTIRNNLKKVGFEKYVEEVVLEKRAEDLGVEDFVRITREIESGLDFEKLRKE